MARRIHRGERIELRSQESPAPAPPARRTRVHAAFTPGNARARSSTAVSPRPMRHTGLGIARAHRAAEAKPPAQILQRNPRRQTHTQLRHSNAAQSAISCEQLPQPTPAAPPQSTSPPARQPDRQIPRNLNLRLPPQRPQPSPDSGHTPQSHRRYPASRNPAASAPVMRPPPRNTVAFIRHAVPDPPGNQPLPQSALSC